MDAVERPTTETFGPDCPLVVDRQVMTNHWLNLTFLHWQYSAEVVQAMLPAGLTVETFDGAAWIGLVPFEMVVSLPHRGPVPWLSRFPETNVRTYVRAADGSTGVWFLSLDASRLPAVATARTTYRLPYFWSEMSVRSRTGHVDYASRRRWPVRRAPVAMSASTSDRRTRLTNSGASTIGSPPASACTRRGGWACAPHGQRTGPGRCTERP